MCCVEFSNIQLELLVRKAAWVIQVTALLHKLYFISEPTVLNPLVLLSATGYWATLAVFTSCTRIKLCGYRYMGTWRKVKILCVSWYILLRIYTMVSGPTEFSLWCFPKMAKTEQWATALNHQFGLVLATWMYLKLTKLYEATIIYTQNANPRYFSTVSICLEAKAAGWNRSADWMGRSTKHRRNSCSERGYIWLHTSIIIGIVRPPHTNNPSKKVHLYALMKSVGFDMYPAVTRKCNQWKPISEGGDSTVYPKYTNKVLGPWCPQVGHYSGCRSGLLEIR
jgi:hypothetical protein